MEDMTEVEVMTGIEVMIGMEIMTVIKGIKNDVKKERRASLQRRLHEVKLGMDKGGYKMKKLPFGTILLALVVVFPIPTMARVDAGRSISLPPPIVFSAPPELVVIPETYAYAVPDLDVDIFFYSQVGGMTIRSIVGEGINGTTNEYPTSKSNGTGGAGKRISIGRSKILGVFKV
jgi:hypothetical protein